MNGYLIQFKISTHLNGFGGVDEPDKYLRLVYADSFDDAVEKIKDKFNYIGDSDYDYNGAKHANSFKNLTIE